MRLPILALAGLLALSGVHAEPAPPIDNAALQRCANTENTRDRLACYDALVTRTPLASMIEERWAIGANDRDVRFDFRPHKQSYFLFARYSDAPNRSPASPSRPAPNEQLSLERTEAKFQISFKVKLADFDDSIGAHLWAGYTQQNQWQVYNGDISRPFRETNYEPELMLAFHPDKQWLGWRWRLLVLGVSHQSNGRSEPLSRSWNRLYAQVGFERDNMAVLLRPWWRIREGAGQDDNPDITKYMGYGDLVGVYRYNQHRFSALLRYRPDTGHGAAQFNWTFPLHRRVSGYVQAFTGYGESLIDYNVRQNTIGVGIALADFL